MVRQGEASSTTLAETAAMLTANSSFEAAGKWWEAAIRQNPTQHAWIRSYVDVLLLQGEAEAAAKFESSIWLRPLSVRPIQSEESSYAAIAEEYFQASNYEMARQYGETSIALCDVADPVFGWLAKSLTQIAIEEEDYATAAKSARTFAANC